MENPLSVYGKGVTKVKTYICVKTKKNLFFLKPTKNNKRVKFKTFAQLMCVKGQKKMIMYVGGW